jgi:hypothetical protein
LSVAYENAVMAMGCRPSGKLALGLALALSACSHRAAPTSAPPSTENVPQLHTGPMPAAPVPRVAHAAAPTDAAGTGPIYDVGDLPPEIGLRWPARPFVQTEAKAATLAQFAEATMISGAHVHVTASLMGDAVVKGSDILVTMDDGVEIQHLVVDHACKRVMLKGGRYGAVTLSLPAQYAPTKNARPDWVIEDVIIDGVEVRSPETAFEIYGRRIAIVRSQTHAGTYSVWCGPVFDFRSEDVIIAGNRFDSAGPEATVRLVSVVRSVTVDNVLRNTRKHNYRVHGDSEYAYAARNMLINSGAMLGTMDEDHINKLWFDDNTFFQQTEDLFNPSRERIGWLHAEGNTAYDNGHDTFLREPPPRWNIGRNKVLPYKAPPPPK